MMVWLIDIDWIYCDGLVDWLVSFYINVDLPVYWLPIIMTFNGHG